MSHDEKKRLPISNEEKAKRQGPSVRERVIQRFKKLAPLAVIAAAPVLNTACDPAPEPYCTEGDPATWVANVTASAVWVDDGTGALQIQVTLESHDQFAYLSGEGYTAKGGTVEVSANDAGGYTLIVTPDAGVTEVTVSGELSCDGYPGPFDVTLSWTGTPKAGDAVTAKVTAKPVN